MNRFKCTVQVASTHAEGRVRCRYVSGSDCGGNWLGSGDGIFKNMIVDCAAGEDDDQNTDEDELDTEGRKYGQESDGQK